MRNTLSSILLTIISAISYAQNPYQERYRDIPDGEHLGHNKNGGIIKTIPSDFIFPIFASLLKTESL
jgi:hypothetical protein